MFLLPSIFKKDMKVSFSLFSSAPASLPRRVLWRWGQSAFAISRFTYFLCDAGFCADLECSGYEPRV